MTAGGRVWAFRAVIVVAVVLAYHNCFDGAFLFDDIPAIVENTGLRDLSNTPSLYRSLRPVTDLTLALNFAVTGPGVAGFHAFNLLVHAAAALVLFELVRFTLTTPRCRGWAGQRDNGLAFAVAVVWAVHPLNTQSVTYVIQRAQALAGLFTLLTVYAAGRAAVAERWRGAWTAAAVLASALAMGSKQDAVAAPVLAVLYDRVFLAGSWRAVTRRWAVHLPVVATCGLLALSIRYAVAGAGEAAPPPAEAVANPPEVMGRAVGVLNAPSAGFTSGGTGWWWRYALTQSEVVLHYLRLAVYPRPLSLDYYDWPVAGGVRDVAPALAVVAALLAATWVLLCRRPPIGFAAAWFFLTLAPTSSVMPIDDVAMEHRTYLPLAAVVTLAVAGAADGVRRLGAAFAWVGPTVLAAVTLALTALTVERNADYHSPEALWRSVVAARPNNGRAHHDLGAYLARSGRPAEAIPHFEAAARLKPSPYTEALLARSLMECGRHAEAIPHFRAALAAATRRTDRQHLEADLPVQRVYFNLGKLLLEHGDPADAAEFCREAVDRFPDAPELWMNLSRVLIRFGRWEDAAAALREAVRLAPDAPLPRNNLGLVLGRLGRVDEAVAQFEEAGRLGPESALTFNNWGATLERAGRTADAVGVYRRGLGCRQPDPRLVFSLARALKATGSEKEGVEFYARGLRTAPRWPQEAAAQAWEMATHPKAELRDPTEAVRLAEIATQATGERHLDPLDALAAAYAAAGRFEAAMAAAEKALRLCGPGPRADAVRERLARYRQNLPFVVDGPSIRR